MRKTAFILALLSLSLPAGLSQPAVADDGCKTKYQEKYDYKTGKYKYKYKKKCRGYKYKESWSGYDGGPPPWAPAHGYRAKYPDIYTGTCDRGLSDSELIGGVLGAVIGGLLGSKVGKGDGKLAATAAGTLLGALAGASIAQSMDTADNECLRKALDAAPDQKEIAWRNPDADAQYKVTPVRSYEDRAGRYCREYITEAVVGGRTEKVYGTACRQPDGAWELMK
ncbi:MAG: glycine zipper 2TM domain-containing protein [Proteobacteria bacterium]|nr:glycine zipper 2TM domain-containing protein [Pseudomonadota bacterium]